MSDKISSGKLYLQRGKQDISVDFHLPLQQHQIDGVRFLYRQFIKKKPGVIQNDPSGYGKCLQILMFIKAMHSSLDKPIFILCEEESLENWKEHFQAWTGFHDVAIQDSNPFTKNKVFINTIKDAHSFCRKNWSIVIMHDNTFAKDKLQTVFKADFKIWVTSVDMKKNLHTFSRIYEWIYPNNRINIEDFTAKNNPRDIIGKSYLLDSFLEDIVIRRNDFLTLFKTKNQMGKKSIVRNDSPKKVSRKNKDPTGTKVKRSKRMIICDDDEITLVSKENKVVPNEMTSIGDDFTLRHEVQNNIDDNEHPLLDNNKNIKSNEMDVESFIRDHNSIESFDFKELDTSDNTSQQSIDSANMQYNTHNEFQKALNDIIENENRTQNDTNMQCSMNTTEEALIDEVSDNAQDSFIVMPEESTMKEENMPLSQNRNHMEKASIINITDDIAMNKETQFVWFEDENLEVNSKTNSNKITISEEEHKSISQTIDKSDKVIKKENITSIPKNFDEKLKEMEEQALKKFKGSFLDKIF